MMSGSTPSFEVGTWGLGQWTVLPLNEPRLGSKMSWAAWMSSLVVEKPLLTIGLISSCADQFSSCALS